MFFGFVIPSFLTSFEARLTQLDQERTVTWLFPQVILVVIPFYLMRFYPSFLTSFEARLPQLGKEGQLQDWKYPGWFFDWWLTSSSTKGSQYSCILRRPSFHLKKDKGYLHWGNVENWLCVFTQNYLGKTCPLADPEKHWWNNNIRHYLTGSVFTFCFVYLPS